MADETMMPQEFQNQNLPDNLNNALSDPNRKDTKDYQASDMEHVMMASNASSWEDVLNYLETKGADDNELTPGEAAHMLIDVRKLADAGENFSNDPEEAMDMAKGTR